MGDIVVGDKTRIISLVVFDEQVARRHRALMPVSSDSAVLDGITVRDKNRRRVGAERARIVALEDQPGDIAKHFVELKRARIDAEPCAIGNPQAVALVLGGRARLDAGQIVLVGGIVGELDLVDPRIRRRLHINTSDDAVVARVEDEISDQGVVGGDLVRDRRPTIHQEGRALSTMTVPDDRNTRHIMRDAGGAGDGFRMVRHDVDHIAVVRRATSESRVQRGQRTLR